MIKLEGTEYDINTLVELLEQQLTLGKVINLLQSVDPSTLLSIRLAAPGIDPVCLFDQLCLRLDLNYFGDGQTIGEMIEVLKQMVGTTVTETMFDDEVKTLLVTQHTPVCIDTNDEPLTRRRLAGLLESWVTTE